MFVQDANSNPYVHVVVRGSDHSADADLGYTFSGMRDLTDAVFQYFRAQLRDFQLSLEVREVYVYHAQFCLARLLNLVRRCCRRGYLLAVNSSRSKNCAGQQPYADDAEIDLGHDSNRRPLVLGFC